MSKLKVGDIVVFFDHDYLDNPENGDVGQIRRFDGEKVWCFWEIAQREQRCNLSYVRPITKLEKALR